jgi:hypothetical protein
MARAGHETIFVARGQHLEAIRRFTEHDEGARPETRERIAKSLPLRGPPRHVGGYGDPDLLEGLARHFRANLDSFLAGEPLLDRVSLP